MSKKIKICGLTQSQNIQHIIALQPDYIGFIFYKKSPRLLNDFSAIPIEKLDNIKKVGVFVNAEKEDIIEKVKRFKLNYVQLHGNESAEYCADLQSKNICVIKAFSIKEPKDFKNTPKYEPYCKYFLFDTKTDLYGGSGKSFYWKHLENYTCKKGFFLSGGISQYNIEDAKVIPHPYYIGIDINSGIEDTPGVKSIEKTQQIIKTIRNE